MTHGILIHYNILKSTYKAREKHLLLPISFPFIS